MKKLMTILVVFALCGTAMAVGSDLKPGKYTYNAGKYTSTSNYSAPLTMNYTRVGEQLGQAYFTTMTESVLNTYKDDNGVSMSKVVVQFLGTDIDRDHGYKDTEFQGNIKEYGIYLYDPNSNKKSDFQNIFNEGNAFELNPDTNFGIYYKTTTGMEWYSTDNYIGTFDDNSHYINLYDKDGNLVLNNNGEGYKVWDSENEEWVTYSDKVNIHYTCTFIDPVNGGRAQHWEFMLQTTMSHPYYNVDANDFEGNGGNEVPDTPTTSGQPLPGTLATLLIGGLCAKTLSKKNKKH